LLYPEWNDCWLLFDSMDNENDLFVTLLRVPASTIAGTPTLGPFTLGVKMRAAARMVGSDLRSLYPGRKSSVPGFESGEYSPYAGAGRAEL
jgi:hypothetical protein